MYPASSPLLTDLYQLNLLQAYLDHGQTDTAVFELFVRRHSARVIRCAVAFFRVKLTELHESI